ncbi:MAG TPA: energy transducer TonB, partial [Steroidobacteraceae bacterium]
ALVQRLPDAERAAAQPLLDGPAQQLRASVIGDLRLAEPPVDYADDSLRRYEQLGVDPLNAERVRIAWLVSDSERARGLPAKGRDRQSKCPEPPGRTSGSDRPSIDRSSLIPLPYPASSQQKNYSGKVELRFHVAASGCVTRIDIYHSVGIDELDDAALSWGEAVRYVPAEQDGQAVDSEQVVSVTFKLTD